MLLWHPACAWRLPCARHTLCAHGRLGGGPVPACSTARQVIETAASIAIIRLGVVKFEPLPEELFKYDIR